MVNLSSEIPKFTFFDEDIYTNSLNLENEEKNINVINKNNIKNKKEDNTININNIFVSGPREIYSINSMLYINGKLIHEKDGKMIRENLIMKIYENQILDLYRVFNGVYYGFRYQIFKDKPLFIIIGGDFDEYMINNNIELFMLTSIKIYDATYFINKELKKLPPQNIMNPKEEPYPQFLIKNIKLLKRLSDSELLCTEENVPLEKYESIQNINSFAINKDFTYAAISLDQGDILLLYAYPNIIECDTNLIKLIYLPKINFREKGHITNLLFTKLNIFNNIKNVLYASTSKIIYYYIWDNKQDSEKDIKLEILNINAGSYNGCIDIRGKYFLMGSSNDDFIYEFENLEIRKTLPFKGKKTNVFYLREYIICAMIDDNFSTLQIYDKKYGIFIYYKQKKEKIIGLCSEDNNFFIIYEKAIDNKYIVKLKEIDVKIKLKKLINKNLFSLAIVMAEKCELDEKSVADIMILYAEDEFNKGKYKESIQLFSKTIGIIEPNKVVFLFKEKSKLEFLIIYLEKYLDHLEFKFNIHSEEYISYTKLLLNCYILTGKLQILKDYISKKEIYFSDEIFDSITEICFETNNVDYVLNLTEKNKKYINYIKILLKLEKKKEGLDYIKLLINEMDINNIENLNDNQNDLNYQIKCEKIQAIFKYFIPYFIIEDDWNKKNKKNSLEKEYFDALTDFVEKNYYNIEEKEIISLMNEFLYLDDYFAMFFDKMINYPIFFDEKIFERRIEIYLNEDKINNKEKILLLLENSIFKSIYNFDSLLFLFKSHDFINGIALISEQRNSFKELFFIYLNNKDYKKLLDIFITNIPKEKSIWLLGLQFFLKELKNNTNDEEKNFFFKNAISLFLIKLLENEIFPSIYILEIINEINPDISLFLIQNFYLNALEKEKNKFVNALVKSRDFDVNLQEINDEIDTLDIKPIDIKIEKCDECNNKINMPCVIFRCKHVYHSSCLNGQKEDNTNYCPKCNINKININEKLNGINETYKSLNNIDDINNILDKQNDTMEYIDELYGKGIVEFNLK